MAEKNEKQIKETLLGDLKKLLDYEKFKIDAYFFCGFSGGTPNEKLTKACDAYLMAAESGSVALPLKEALVAELENAVTILQKERADTMTNNIKAVQEILEYRAYL